MQTIYPNLAIGNHVDMYVALYVQSTFVAVLDLTSELSTRKWNRNGLALKKIGLAKNKAIAPSKIQKAIDFIQEHRSQNHSVLVGCDDGQRSKLIGIAYLITKGYDIAEAAEVAGGADVESLSYIIKFVEKVAVKEEVAL